MENRPWPDFGRGKPITASGVARLLKPFGVRPKSIRTGTGTQKGYEMADFEDAFARYLLPQAGTPEQTSQINGLAPDGTGTDGDTVPDDPAE